MKKIEDVINSIIRPALIRDGGDIELVDINGDEWSASGACSSCMTFRDAGGFVQRTGRRYHYYKTCVGESWNDTFTLTITQQWYFEAIEGHILLVRSTAMPQAYTISADAWQRTLKGQASGCASPGCGERFRDNLYWLCHESDNMAIRESHRAFAKTCDNISNWTPGCP